MQKSVLVWLFFSLFFLLKADDTSAYGWKIANTPLYIGGYISVNYDDDGSEEEKLIFDDIALLLYGDFGKLDLLGELEISDIPFKRQDFKIHCERLRLAYYLHDDTVIHVGKFNSNIGFWNQIPINVLEDTTTYPHLLENVFPKLTTGMAIYQSFDEGDKELSLTMQKNQDLDDSYNNIIVDRHFGVSYKDSEESFSWRLSGGYFRTVERRDYYYLGLGYQKELLAWMFTGEVFTKQGEVDDSIPYDGYMQATWHLYYHHDVIFRTEFYKDDNVHLKENISLLGYTYRPVPSIAIKGEYVNHTELPKSRFVASFSWIF